MLPLRKFARGCLATVGLALVACGSDDDKTPQQEFASRYADLMCPRLNPCCKAVGEPNDVGSCKTFIGFLSGGSKLKFNQGAADACLAALASWSCTEPEPEVCNNVLSGTTQPGGTCDSNGDCAAAVSGGVTCHFDFSGGSDSKGTCKLEPTPAVGQPCGADADTATEHFVCDQDSALYCNAGTCTAKSAIGQKCSGYDSCEPGAFCDQNAVYECVPLSPIGQPCGSTGCVEGAYCDSTSTCARKKAMGEPCQSYDECDGTCDTTTSKCRPSATICFSND